MRNFRRPTSIKPKATAKGAKHFKLAIHSPLRAQSRFVQDHSRLLPMRSSGFSKCVAQKSNLSWTLVFDFLFVARVIEVNLPIFCIFRGPQHVCLFVYLQISCFSLLGPCTDTTRRPTLVPRLLAEGRANPSQPAVARIFCFSTFVVSMKVRKTLSPCVCRVSLSAPSRKTAPRKSAVNLGRTTSLDLISFCRSPFFTDV